LLIAISDWCFEKNAVGSAAVLTRLTRYPVAEMQMAGFVSRICAKNSEKMPKN